MFYTYRNEGVIMISKLNSVSYSNVIKQHFKNPDISFQDENTSNLSSNQCNLNNLPCFHYNKISFGIDDAGKKHIAKREDGSLEYDANREIIQGIQNNLDSNLEYRMADRSKCFVDESKSISFYPEDIEKLKAIDNVKECI